MAIDPSSVTNSRRAVLAAGLGGLAAFVAHAIGRPLPARAGTDGDVVLGQPNTATTTTVVTTSTTDAFGGVIDPPDGHDGGALWPSAGVVGVAREPALVGVRGVGRPGVLGYGGVMGRLQIGDFWDIEGMPPDTAVYGSAIADQSPEPSPTVGVHGRGHGAGVLGDGDDVGGLFHGRVAVRAQGPTALEAQGAVKFSSAGLGTVARGTRSKIIYPGLDLTPSSKIFVTLQGNPGGTTTFQRVVISTFYNRFAVVLTANATASTPFAWFVIS